MAKKLPRKRDHSDLVPAQSRPMPVGDLDPGSALILGTAHVAQSAVTAYGQVATAYVQATGDVLSTAIESFGECFKAYMGLLREREITVRDLGVEREITARVLGAEREKTARVEAWAATVIAEAQEQTEQLRIRADLVLTTIRDNQSRRESKLEVIDGFMRMYSAWDHTLRGLLAGRATGMSLQERELHRQHIDALLERAWHMEQAICSIAVTL